MPLRFSRTADLNELRALFREYADELAVDLGFQGFDAELASLPLPYDTILLAEMEERPAGCAAIKPLEGATCELKRLYVRPGFRNRGLGRALVEATLAEARRRNYRTMRLDTLARLGGAVALYRALGFQEIAPYYENPLTEPVLFMERPL